MSIVRSVGAAFVLLAAFAAGVDAQSTAAAPAPDTRVVTTEPIHAVVLPMKGPYEQHPTAFERLGAFIAGRGITPTGDPLAWYFSDPSVGEADLVWEVGFPVPSGVTAEAPFEVRDLPATLSAVRLHRGPYEDLGPAWSDLVQWVFTNGYQPVGPACHVFQGDPAAPVVEMRLPVQKAQ